MSTEKQSRANRENAQHSTGPRTEAGRRKIRFNALTHGLYAQCPVLPDEDPAAFDRHRDVLVEDWAPTDEMEKSFVERIAIDQWKLARIDREEGRLFIANTSNPNDFVKPINTWYIIQNRLQRALSNTIRDIEKYRAMRLKQANDKFENKGYGISDGIVERTEEGERYFDVLPLILGLDNKWRSIPRDVMGDFTGRPRFERGPVGPGGPIPPVPGYDDPEDAPLHPDEE
jgi:hypothetical protein